MEHEKICRVCRDNPNAKGIYRGYNFCRKTPINNKCWNCGNELEDIILTTDEVNVIYCVNRDGDLRFLEAMIELKEKDPIEFQLKMSQFRALQNQPQSRAEQSTDKITCPKCGSTAIDSGTRGFTLTTGFLGSSNHRNVCKKCGYKWKPGSWAETRDRHLYGNK